MSASCSAGVHGVSNLCRGLAAFACCAVASLAAAAAPSSYTYSVEGNTLLSAAQIARALGASPARPRLRVIREAAQRLQLAYRKAGYGTVVVQVPPQTISLHRIELRVIEGRLSQVDVAGLRAFTRANVLRGLPALRVGHVPDLAALDSELLMVNENPAKAVRVVFQPGQRLGQVQSLVVVRERPIRQWTLGLDNTGNAQTGRTRATLAYRDANLLDSDSVLRVRLQASPDRPADAAMLSTTLRQPLYARHMFLEWSALASNTSDRPIATPAGELRFTGKGYSAGVRALWLQPLLGRYRQEFSVGVDARRYRNDCSLGSFGAAGCGAAGASLDVLPLTLGYQVQRAGGPMGQLSLVQNLPVGSAGDQAAFDAARPGSSSSYHLLRLDALGQHGFAAQRRLDWRVDAQYSPQPLVFAEQFGIGGARSVRGYPETALVGDSGASGSLQFSVPLAQGARGTPGAVDGLRAVSFVDAGTVADRQGVQCLPGQTHCSIWGAGVGLRLRIESALLRLDVARAGETAGGTQRGDWRVHADLVFAL